MYFYILKSSELPLLAGKLEYPYWLQFSRSNPSLSKCSEEFVFLLCPHFKSFMQCALLLD